MALTYAPSFETIRGYAVFPLIVASIAFALNFLWGLFVQRSQSAGETYIGHLAWDIIGTIVWTILPPIIFVGMSSFGVRGWIGFFLVVAGTVLMMFGKTA